VSTGKNPETEQLNLQGYPAGIYFVKLSNDKRVQVKRLLIY
jgi:hypothetical protein